MAHDLASPAVAPNVPVRLPLWRRVFLGPVRLRAGWRLLLFTGLLTAIGVLAKLVFDLFRREGPGWTPLSFVIDEPITLAIGLAATWVMSRIDRLPFAVFGIVWRDAFRARFWEGSLWGLVAVVLLVGAIALGGGYHLRGLALRGPDLARMTAVWLAGMMLLGLSEEVMFRGYALAALADGMRFWPAAALLSIQFALVHYFGKPMENLADALSVGLLGLFLCFTIRRTGSLWFAIGFHFAFDLAALSVFGAPNTGNDGKPIPGHLLDGTFSGPDWLTGGVRGVEASWLVFPVIAALFVFFHLRHRETRFPVAHA